MKVRLIKKWTNMLLGKGTLHVRKGEGPNWSKDTVKGFYIDYSGKLSTKLINQDGLPLTRLATGAEVIIPISVIQYGLGCYEAVIKGDTSKKQGFYTCVDYLLSIQKPDGSWEAFKAQKTHDVMSSMVQGEGASLLIRAFIDSGNERYLDAAKAACAFMLVDKSNGGTAEIVEGHTILLESTEVPMILNGAIYSMFGLFDLWLLTKDESIKRKLDDVLLGIESMLPEFDTGYWSLYCLNGAIASPFYHDLHIVQLNLLYKLTGKDVYKLHAEKYEKYYNSKISYGRAFIKKAFQKLTEKTDMIAIVE